VRVVAAKKFEEMFAGFVTGGSDDCRHWEFRMAGSMG
jgi:hypothetical protein